MSELPLKGITVIAIEQAVAAPLCTVRLADAGARVIKIERAGGETARHYDATVAGQSAYFVWLNRGKESAVLDLKDAADLALLRRMLARADVLVQNLIPGAMARMGMANADLARDFPHLIAVSIVGYGQDTAYAGMRAYDMLVQAESGLCSVTGAPDAPAKVGVSAADIATGMNAHAAILEALIARAKTGQGCRLEIAMFDSMADWMTVPLLHFEHAGRETGRHGMAHASIYPYRPFACADGSVIVAVQNNGEWDRFCNGVLLRPDLLLRTEFATNALRVANRAALDAEAVPELASLTIAQVIDRLDNAGVAWGRSTQVEELGRHPALRRTPVTLSSRQVVTMPRPAGRCADFHPGAVPDLGAQTVTVRAEFSKKS